MRAAREHRGLSVRRLAALAGLSPAYLSRIERGERGLSADVADRLEAALKREPIRIDVDWRVLRERLDLPAREAARRAAIDCAVLSRIERGKAGGDAKRGEAACEGARNDRAATLS